MKTVVFIAPAGVMAEDLKDDLRGIDNLTLRHFTTIAIASAEHSLAEPHVLIIDTTRLATDAEIDAAATLAERAAQVVLLVDLDPPRLPPPLDRAVRLTRPLLGTALAEIIRKG